MGQDVLKLPPVVGMRVKCINDKGNCIGRGTIIEVSPGGSVGIEDDMYRGDPNMVMFVRDYITSWWEPE